MRLSFKYKARRDNDWKQNYRHKFASNFTMDIYVCNSLYTHIPKNASTSIRFSIAVANGVISEDGDVGWVYNNNMTFVSNLRSQVLADYSFIFLRCPYSRLASAFLDQVVR